MTVLPLLLAVGIAGPGAPSLLPFDQYEAEEQQTDGSVIGPDRQFGTLAAEASGRKAVRFDRAGQSLHLRLVRPANALTVRYSVPDSADGRGLDGRLGVHVDGQAVATVPVTSRFSWLYGKYPFSNRPGDGRAHHFWGEVRLRLPRTLPAGSVVSIVQPADGRLAWTAIDVVDLELAQPPVTPSPGALSLARFGADSSGRRDSGAAVRAAVRQARRRGVPLYVPPGRYRVNGHLLLDRVTIEGAGPWHSLLFGAGIGLCSRPNPAVSTDVHVSRLAIEGEVHERRDDQPLSAVCGRFRRSSFTDLFLHRTKVGVWIDGPGEEIVLARLRITDQTADGINLHRAIRSAVIEQNFIRNTGDDGIALWSEKEANSDIAIRNNHVVAPSLANGIALYGGHNITVTGNVVADTLTQGGGIHLGTRFKSAPFTGNIDIRDNLLERTGSFDPNWQFGVGALWFYSLEQPIDRARITITGLRIDDSTCEAIQFIGAHHIGGITLDGVTASNVNGAFLALRSGGAADFRNVRVRGTGSTQPVAVPANFALRDLGGNEGWTRATPSREAIPDCT